MIQRIYFVWVGFSFLHYKWGLPGDYLKAGNDHKMIPLDKLR